MQNKMLNHMARHRVGYLVLALLLVVGAFSLIQSVPNFYALNNNALTGNLGELSNNSSGVSLQGYQYRIIVTNGSDYSAIGFDDFVSQRTTGYYAQMPITFQSNGDRNSLYLVPEDRTQSTITIASNVDASVGERGYTWQIPANLAAGEYWFGISNGDQLAKSNSPFAVVRLDQAERSLSMLDELLSQTNEDLNAYQTQSRQLNSSIESQSSELENLEQSANRISSDLAAMLSRFESQKESLSVTQYEAMTEEIHALSLELSRAKLNVEMAQAKLADLKFQQTALETAMANSEVKISALTQAQSILQGFTDVELSTLMEAQKAEISSNTLMISDNNLSLSDLESQIEAKKLEITRLKGQADALAKQLVGSELEITEAEGDVRAAMVQAEEYKLALSEAQAQVESLNREISVTEDRATLVELEVTLKDAQAEVTQFQELMINAQADTNTAMERLSSGKRINALYQDEMNELQAQISTLEVELAALVTQSQRLESEMELTTLEMEAESSQMEQLKTLSGESTSSTGTTDEDMKFAQ